jgi:probable addiction module antidote protein
MRRKASVSHDEAIIRRLRKDPDFAAEYLKAALEDEDEPRVLLIALRHLAQAQGIAKVAKAAGIERESLYRALSEHGNPRLSTLVAVTKAIGLRLTVEPCGWRIVISPTCPDRKCPPARMPLKSVTFKKMKLKSSLSGDQNM